MISIEELRIQLKAYLSGLGTQNVAVYTETPEKLAANKNVVVEPSDPYVTQGPVYGEYDVTFDVTLIVKATNNKVNTDSMDDLIVAALRALDETWQVGEVGRPVPFEKEGTQYMGTTFTITNQITRS